MARYPGATWRPLPKTSYNAGARTANLVLNLALNVTSGTPSVFNGGCTYINAIRL